MQRRTGTQTKQFPGSFSAKLPVLRVSTLIRNLPSPEPGQHRKNIIHKLDSQRESQAKTNPAADCHRDKNAAQLHAKSGVAEMAVEPVINNPGQQARNKRPAEQQ